MPQEKETNRFRAWKQFETFTIDLVEERGWELYTIAGGAGALSNGGTDPLKELHGINTPEWFWKVIVAVKPGQGLANITANTPVIAVQFPNYPVSPDPNNPDAPDPRLWSTWTVTIKEIETLTGLDLLSALPDPIEKALQEKERYTGSSDADLFPSPTSLIAPLLVENTLEKTNNFSSIRQNRITENGSLQTMIFNPIRKINTGLTQINIGQVDSLQHWFGAQDCSIQVSSSKIGISQRAFNQISKAEIRSTQIGLNQNSLGNNGMAKASSSQVGSFQASTPQISVIQVSPTQVRTTQLGSDENTLTQVDTWQLDILKSEPPFKLNSTEIPFSRNISLQQFLSSHHYNSQNTTIPAWAQFLQDSTPFNLNIEITDLPTGQLAVACRR